MTTIDGALGATWDGAGTHFRVYSSLATAVALCLFDESGAERQIVMAAEPGFLWHAYVPGVGPGQAYGFRVDGPYDPERGLRCNPAKLLSDPYALALSRDIAWSQALFSYPLGGDELAMDPSDSAAGAPRSYVVDRSFDWGDDRPPQHAPEHTVLYELHVKGFTKTHPGVPEDVRGTFAGLASPAAIDAIQSLGVTSVELMPVHQFAHEPHLLDQGRRNYWGYHTYGFFAPHAEYAAAGDRGGQVREFKAMVKALHAAGLEVILDVVYNHTAEGNHLGPTLGFKGFDNPAYYHLVPDAPRYYMDYTGTGNSVNLRHPYVLQLVMDSLRYWVQEMHVDGFRFDLAATLARGAHTIDTWSSFFCTIHQDPVLQRVKLIAEPWDTGSNGYQVGNFPAHWSEWNDQYRESVRRFWCEDPGGLAELASRVSGSADLFQRSGRPPSASINYIASHDGLTLRDLAEASPRLAGIEAGPERDAARGRLQRNLLATVALSIGTPMFGAGDEWGRSQQGHDNAYDQDNAMSWLGWDTADGGLRAFVQHLLERRAAVAWLHCRQWPGGACALTWLRPDAAEMSSDDWAAAHARVALLATGHDQTTLLVVNGSDADEPWQLPGDAGATWQVWVDTSTAEVPAEPPTTTSPFTAPARSITLLARTLPGATA